MFWDVLCKIVQLTHKSTVKRHIGCCNTLPWGGVAVVGPMAITVVGIEVLRI